MAFLQVAPFRDFWNGEQVLNNSFLQIFQMLITLFNKGLWYIPTMRLLFVADGRSPTTLSWLNHWIKNDHQVHLISTYPCQPTPGLASFHILPIAFGGRVHIKSTKSEGEPRGGLLLYNLGYLRNFLRKLRYLLGPASLPYYRKRFLNLVDEITPDLVHALRIPFEGMLAASTPLGVPMVISTWGNDLTLHARGSLLMSWCTKRTLQRADGLIADTSRDIRLGQKWGFASNRPSLVIPGSGGISFEEIHASKPSVNLPEELPDVPIVLNPRGNRPGSLRQDIFFKSIPLVLEKFPQALFICLNMDEEHTYHMMNSLDIQANTRLWSKLDHSQMIALYKKAWLFVSPSIHDGTPNSLLEAMACGCFPVVGDIESMREWITPGINGLLADATSPKSLADAMVTSLSSPAMRAVAREKNATIIVDRAEYHHCMAMTEAFYQLFSH
jgi:glycosyltransferase involved in cell wall biosynthesis